MTPADPSAQLARYRIAEFHYSRAAAALQSAAQVFTEAERMLAAAERALAAVRRSSPANQPPPRRLSRRQCLIGMAMASAVGATLLLWAVAA